MAKAILSLKAIGLLSRSLYVTLRLDRIVIFLPLLLASCHKENKTPVPKPNIVFIAVDDLRPDLGCYGNPIAQSPNLDKLAAEGFLFQNHFVNVPTCGASRHALLTGMRPTTKAHLDNDITSHVLSNQPETDIPETFIHQLKRNGYHTVGIGKISHSADGLVYGYTEQPSNKRELPYSWDELLFNPGKWKTGWNAFFGYANGENRQSLNRQVTPYEKGKVSDTGYVDGLTTQLAIDKLKELKNHKKPFFLGVGLFKPHLPFTAPEKYWNLYDRATIPVSPNPMVPTNVNLKSLHDSGELNGYKLGEEKPSLSQMASEPYAKKLKHAYYACISYTDSQIGRIVDQIKSLGLDDNTIIVVWGDHGWHLGDQQVWGKHTIFENALRSTLIIKTPHNTHPKPVSSIVETVDIYPSLLDLCDIAIKHPIDGESFTNLFTSDVPNTGNEVAYSYFRNGISVRTERYRLTKYFRTEEPTIELYDHQTDPLESKNLASEFPDIVNKLMPILDKGDTGLY
ncbi:sulfatase [Aestuariivivens insulae]|uniref:sulfatase n=1 Tax=Aestuariivivens insulae TaxID=1621988 RepID=UPI001F59B383|nr:sulfatase [Aestuariivivens insulae]